MLVPHRREDAEFGEASGTRPMMLEDALVFVGLQPVGGDQVRGDLGFGSWQGLRAASGIARVLADAVRRRWSRRSGKPVAARRSGPEKEGRATKLRPQVQQGGMSRSELSVAAVANKEAEH